MIFTIPTDHHTQSTALKVQTDSIEIIEEYFGNRSEHPETTTIGIRISMKSGAKIDATINQQLLDVLYQIIENSYENALDVPPIESLMAQVMEVTGT